MARVVWKVRTSCNYLVTSATGQLVGNDLNVGRPEARERCGRDEVRKER